ncbi:hypothetical protein PROFUN_10438 [Planoprotostelium fungivorum]|uniref:Uncharacterized protein n=1 Tax=Planoprotostelium fungivorum TaxID=1890364 RepID=A0A2P6NDY3_9EUKA|nr:hypothetical protein PROFUN_10438 [Planoprotostelium fungivorum]
MRYGEKGQEQHRRRACFTIVLPERCQQTVATVKLTLVVV